MRRRRQYRPRTSVLVDSNAVIKESTVDPRAEFIKAAAIAELASSCGFVAPRPLSFDAGNGTVTYERLDVGAPVGEAIDIRRGAQHSTDLVERCGAVLAVLHSRLDVAEAPFEPLPSSLEPYLSKADRSFLVAEATAYPVIGHGDYSVWNVLQGPPARPHDLVVLDCCPNLYSSFRALVRESRYIDLSVFDSCLLGRAGLTDFLRARPRELTRLREAFLSGYTAVAKTPVDRKVLARVTEATLAAYFRSRKRWPNAFCRALSVTVSARQWRFRNAISC